MAGGLAIAPGADAANVTTGGGRVRITTSKAVAEVRLASFRLRVRDRGGRLLTGEATGGGLFFERAGSATPVTLGRVQSTAKIADGAVLTVTTSEGAPATVTVRFTSERTLEVTLEPPSPATLAAYGGRFRSPASEVIYGLTERLRDGPLALGGALEIPEDDIKPPEVGSLDRRGEIVEMLIRPTFSLYAPFFQSSRGYGLAVTGTTVGSFDVAKTDPQVVSFRFEAGTTPEHRRLRFHVFVGPEHRTILDEYTALTGRPFVPPDWAFLHWRWRGELERGPTTILDGVEVNAQARRGHPNVRRARHRARRLRVRPAGAERRPFGFSRFEWDPSACRTRRRCSPRSEAVATAS